MDKQSNFGGSPSPSSPQALPQGRDPGTLQSTGATARTTTAAAAAATTTATADAGHTILAPPPSRPPSASGGGDGLDHHRVAPRPRRSWDAAFLASTTTTTTSSSRDFGGGGNDSAGLFRPRPPTRTTSNSSAAPAGGAGGAAGAGSRPGVSAFGADSSATEGQQHGGGSLAGMTGAGAGGGGGRGAGGSQSGDAVSCDAYGGAPGGAGGGASCFFGTARRAGAAAAIAGSTAAAAAPTTDSRPSPTPACSSSSSSSSSRTGGVVAGSDDLTDTSDEQVMARLAEFTEMARSTTVQNEELSRELASEKRRAAHIARKLEQSNITCTELRESLALAQDTVMKLREHEMSWADTTASEMSLRAELCALKDEYSSASGNASVLRKRCDSLQRENAELGERLATLAEEKRQVESRARRLLRSDRYRGY